MSGWPRNRVLLFDSFSIAQNAQQRAPVSPLVYTARFGGTGTRLDNCRSCLHDPVEAEGSASVKHAAGREIHVPAQLPSCKLVHVQWAKPC
jgi:hypothetical protein